jgi:hypothetical protein
LDVPLLCRKHLDLTLRRQLTTLRIGRWIGTGAEQVRSLVVQAQRLNRSDHGAPPATRYEQGLLTHLPRKRARQRMPKKVENALPVTGQQSCAQTVQKRQHR